MKNTVKMISIALLTLSATACTKNKDAEKKDSPQTSPAEQTAKTEVSTELKITDVKVGTGAEAVAGMTVSVHYTGTFLSGKTFDSSRKRNTPFSFRLGAGQVIKGWDQGVVGMKVGGQRKLEIPPSLAYGERGAGSVIPPNTTLAFDIELMDVKK